MASIYRHSDSNKRKTWLLLSGFFLFVILVGYIFSLALDNRSILFWAIGISIFSSFYSYWYSDKLVLSISGAKELKPADNLELYRLVENLAITAGLPLPKIYLINDASPNAFATGRNKNKAVVAVTTGLLARLERSELEGVIAHELAHIGNRDIQLATLITVLVGLIVLLADWFVRFSFYRRSGSGDSKNNKGQLIIMLIAIVLAILAPFFAYLMQFAISRKREYLAHADAALLTRYPEGLARALEKISADPNPLQTANRATAHLFIASPLKDNKKKGNFFTRALATHPPIEERVRRLREANR